jgi:hypothetical protein
MAVLLIQKETIHVDDIERILGQRSKQEKSLSMLDKVQKEPLLLNQFNSPL